MINNKREKNLYIRVMELAHKFSKGFGFSDIIDNKDLNLEDWEKKIIEGYFYDSCQRFNTKNNTNGETIFLYVSNSGDHNKSNDSRNKYILNLEAEFHFLDYQELKFARENAQEARRFSIWAIVISVLAIIVSALIPFIVAKVITQDVKLKDTQFQKIEDGINLLNLKDLLIP